MIEKYYWLFIAVIGAGLALPASGCHQSVPVSHAQLIRKDSLLPTIAFKPEDMGDFDQCSGLYGLTLSFDKDPKYLYIVNGVVLSGEKKRSFSTIGTGTGTG